MKFNKSSYFPLQMLSKQASEGILFGPTTVKAERCWLYPNHKLKLNSTIIWIPEKKIHIGIASYTEAQETNDEEALEKLKSLGIPLGIKFTADNDFSGTYEIDNSEAKSAKKHELVEKTMHVQFGGHYDTGGTFKPGDLVKVTMRKWFMGKDKDGKKQFMNGYDRA